MNINSKFLMTIAATAALGAAACGGKESKHEESAEHVPLGSEQAVSGESAIRTQKQVTRTITSESNIPTVRTSTIHADLNRLDEKQFAALGFPSDVAKNAVQYRNDHGGFKSVDELKNVDGMNDDLFNRMSDKLGVSRSK